MIERFRRALVESYIGAIGLGYMLTQCILHFVNVFASPIANWIARNEYREVIPRGNDLTGFSAKDGLPELVRFLLLFLIWYLLVRWLYFTPIKSKTPGPTQNSEQTG
jgi:hypothetical protein